MAPATATASGAGHARMPPPPRRVSGPSVRNGAVALPAPPAARATGDVRARPARARPPDGRPPAARARVDLARRDPARRHRRHAGLAAEAQRRHLARGRGVGDARAPELRLEASIARLSRASGSARRPRRSGMIMPPAGRCATSHVRSERRPGARGRAHAPAERRGPPVDGQRRGRAGFAAGGCCGGHDGAARAPARRDDRAGRRHGAAARRAPRRDGATGAPAPPHRGDGTTRHGGRARRRHDARLRATASTPPPGHETGDTDRRPRQPTGGRHTAGGTTAAAARHRPAGQG